MVTQTSPIAQLPPTVTLAVATLVVPENKSNDVAEAAGAIASPAARIDAINTVIRTTIPPYFGRGFPGKRDDGGNLIRQEGRHFRIGNSQLVSLAATTAWLFEPEYQISRHHRHCK